MDKLRKNIKSFIDILSYFKDAKTCREFLEEQRWHGTPICPHCGTISQKHYKLKTKGEYNGKYKCCECREVFTVTTGTMFHGNHIPLQKWFYAIYIFISHKKGISSIQLAKDINVTQKSAWFMLNRIRYNMYDRMKPAFEDMTQVDETYVGGRNKGRIKGAQGRSLKTKVPVVGLLSNGMVKTIVVPNTDRFHLQTIIDVYVRKESTVITDGWLGYSNVKREYNHKVVDHGKYEYVKDGFHTNSIEGYWSHLKRGIKGIYHKVSKKHLWRYCGEFDFRYNTRKIDDITKFVMFVVTGYRRLAYKELLAEYEIWGNL